MEWSVGLVKRKEGVRECRKTKNECRERECSYPGLRNERRPAGEASSRHSLYKDAGYHTGHLHGPGRWRSPAKHRAKKDVSSKAIAFISTDWLSRITAQTIESQTRLVASRLDVLRLSSGLSCVYPGPSGGSCDGAAPACLARDRVSASFRRHASRFDRPTRSSVAVCLCRPLVRCKSSDFRTVPLFICPTVL